jgi:hypothetical protein
VIEYVKIKSTACIAPNPQILGKNPSEISVDMTENYWYTFL